MQLINLKQNAQQKLIANEISANEAVIETEILLNHIFGVTKKDLFLNPDMLLKEEQLESFNLLVEKRIKEKIPVQYLTNKAYFMGEEFFVNQNVLIPRPETELLVEEVIRHCEKQNNETIYKILDIGTGSGCIACMITKNISNPDVYACDISKEALEVAEFNAKKLKVNSKIKFIQSNLFENIDKNSKFDIIVSNPPYIPISEKYNLQQEVVLHEPHNALFAEDKEGICFYEKIAEQSKNHFEKNGILIVEIGINQADAVKNVFEKHEFKNIKIIEDYNKIKRVIVAKY
jgi:release factor glutamine methyltransferase